MKLKQAILRVMGMDVLKQAVNHLEIDDVDRRSVREHIVELGNVGKDTGAMRLKDEAKGLAFLSDEMKRRVVAIMCQCKEPEECHRSVVARKMTERMPGLRIEHLRAPSQA